MNSNQHSDDFQCPLCKSTAHDLYEFPHWRISAILLLPPLDLLLGMRMPRALYICRNCPESLIFRQYIRCPGCRRFHHGLLWSSWSLAGHWFGLFCPDCGARIQSIVSVCSMLLIGATFIFWWPLWRLAGPRWIAFDQARMRRAREKLPHRLSVLRAKFGTRRSWVRLGLSWGFPMWIIMTVRMLFQTGSRSVLSNILLAVIQLPFWLLGGLLFGYVMKRLVLGEQPNTPGQCVQCGYNLSGNVSGICPECGTRIERAEPAKT